MGYADQSARLVCNVPAPALMDYLQVSSVYREALAVPFTMSARAFSSHNVIQLSS